MYIELCLKFSCLIYFVDGIEFGKFEIFASSTEKQKCPSKLMVASYIQFP